MTDGNNNKGRQTWVVFRLGHLGDVVLATGVLDYLARKYGWDFIFVTRKAFTDVFEHNPHVRRVVALGDDDLSFAAFRRICARLAREYSGCGLMDLHGSLRSRLLAAMWKGPVARYRKMSLERRLFLMSGGRAFRPLLRAWSVTQRYLMAMEKNIPEPEALRPRIWLGDDETARARQRLDSLFGQGARPIALHPFATHRLKSWPEEHWRALAALLDTAEVPWFVLGRGEPLFPGSERDLTNSTSLRESCTLLSQSRVLVSGDSGPMHLASAVGTPVIALFGPTTREWGFFPAGGENRILELPLACRPCSLHGRTPCERGGECLASIMPEDVFGAITSCLS